MWKWALVVALVLGAYLFGRHTPAETPAQKEAALQAIYAQPAPAIVDPWKEYQNQPQAVYAQPTPVDDTSAQLRQIQETQHRMQSDAREAAYQAQQQAAELKSEQRTQALIDGIRH